MNKTFSNIFKRQHKNTKKNTDGHCLIDQASEIDQAYAIITRHMNAPRLNIETEVSPDVLNRLMKKVEETWSRLGQEDAHWSVITNEKFRKDSLSDHLDDFFASGEGDISRVEAALNRVGASLSEMNSIMDYGCGVGRLSIPLAKRCQHVLGVDISLAHLHEANANIERASLKNIDLSLAVSIGKLRELPEFDLVLSLIVLQHNSPPVMLEILKILCSRVRGGGYLYIQTQTYKSGYIYGAEADLANSSKEMAMHVLPQDIFLQTIQDAGLSILEVTEDGSAGSLEFRSQVVLAKRR